MYELKRHKISRHCQYVLYISYIYILHIHEANGLHRNLSNADKCSDFMINANEYTDFINANKYADSMFNTKNF